MNPTGTDTGQTPTHAEILYGVAGWSYSDWEGLVYPAGADAATKLLTVASACDLLEINTSFYATPKPQVASAWARRLARAGLNTRLTVKLNRVFTHEPDYTPADVQAVRNALAPLDDDPVVDASGVEHPRLLGLLIQFPHFFRLTPENSQRLERLAEDFADWTRIVELRHRSWAREIAYDWLAKHGFCLANIDLPGGRPGRSGEPGENAGSQPPPEHAFPSKVVATGPVGYLRLHGRNAAAWFDRKAAVDQKYNYLYTDKELGDLADRVRELARRTRTVVVVGNNHYRGKALATVLSLANLVEGRRARLPAPMLDEYPQVRRFAEPAEPIRLPPRDAAGGERPRPAPRKQRAKPPSEPPPKDNGQLRLFQ